MLTGFSTKKKWLERKREEEMEEETQLWIKNRKVLREVKVIRCPKPR